MRTTLLRIVLATVIVFQVFFAAAFAFAPDRFAALMGLPPAPGWAVMMFALFSARALAFAYGLALAFRDPYRHRAWIAAMIGVQALDWIAAMTAIASGAMSLSQVTTAAYMPLAFIVGLSAFFPRRPRAVAPAQAPAVAAV